MQWQLLSPLFTLPQATQIWLFKTAAGVSPLVISGLEDANYDRYNLKMLSNIAHALHHRVEVRFVSKKEDYVFS